MDPITIQDFAFQLLKIHGRQTKKTKYLDLDPTDRSYLKSLIEELENIVKHNLEIN